MALHALKRIALALFLLPSIATAQSISQLPAVQSLTGSEITVVVQGGVTKKASVGQVAGSATLPVIGGNTVLGNSQSTATNATALAIPGCSGTLNALVYTLGSGFGCDTLGTLAGLSYPGGTSTFLRSDGSWASVTLAPGGSSGQIQYNNGGALGGFTVSGDGTLNTSTGILTVTKTNGSTFGNCATQSSREITSGTSTTLTPTADCNISVKLPSPAAFTVNLPSSPSSGETHTIGDGSGTAQSYPITIIPPGGVLISGMSSMVLRGNWVSQTIWWTGTQWLGK